ncbi:MAG: glyoxylate carboligase [Clostridiales Family XIII bacterium]|jgi:tartronate-semialdehyde synthase|nr:glyoxylate carboligase [Clostridiales Family XIII bacterium]
MKAAELVVKILEKEGITDAFGIPGAGINPVYRFLKDAGIRHCCMRHEEACVHAADGYFKASNRIALAICTSGPGATNFVTGIYSANIDSVPVLAITGQANSWQLGQEAFQCVDIAKICEPVAKKTYCVKNAADIPEVFREAFFLMRSGRPGAVLVDLPLDVQQAELDYDPNGYEPAAVERPAPPDADIERALDMLDAAKSPLILMGGGAILAGGEAELVALAEYLRIPVIMTFMAKGGMPSGHPLNAGHAGIQVGQPLGNRVFLDSDLVLGVGCRFSDRHTGDLKVYRGERRFIHVDVSEGQFGRIFPADLNILSDARLAAEALLAGAKRRGMRPVNPERADSIAGLREKLRRRTDFAGRPMPPHRVFHEINRGFDSDTIFTSGCGITQIWSGQLQDIDRPRRYIPSGGAGTLGFEIPGAFGAKVACPDSTVCAVVGDFGFTFMGEELAVASALGRPIIVIIVNNAYLGLIVQNQVVGYGFEYEVGMPQNQDGRIDYLKVAEGYGCAAERVFGPDELAAAIGRAKSSGRTYVIEAICDPKQFCDMGAGLDSCRSFAPDE